MLLQHHMKIIVGRFHLPLPMFVFSVLCSSLSHSLVLCFLISLPPLYVKFIPPMLSDDVTTLPSSSLFVFRCRLSGHEVCSATNCCRLSSPTTNQYHARRELRLHNAPRAITRIRNDRRKMHRDHTELEMCLSLISACCKIFLPVTFGCFLIAV